MSPPVFVAPSAALASGEEVVLDGAEGRHAVTVRRMRVGEVVMLTDGQGLQVVGTVSEAAPPDRLTVTVTERRSLPVPTPRVSVVQAIPKGDRAELAVSLMTEVGVDAVVPWAAARCVARWEGERGTKARRRWESTAVESGKQARRARFPTIGELVTIEGVVAQIRSAAAALVLHEAAAQPLSFWTPPTDGDIVLVVGPEGGITDDELGALRDAGAELVHAGPSVMRSSTAGAAAAAVVLARAGRWDALSR
jgi:16S rRNA (uracil1498-N3)-methyltransferase